jgi:hypothetical protein
MNFDQAPETEKDKRERYLGSILENISDPIIRKDAEERWIGMSEDQRNQAVEESGI